MIRIMRTLREPRCRIATNREQAFRDTFGTLSTQPIETILDGRSHGTGHGFTRQTGEFLDQSVRLAVLDVQAHG